MSVCIKVIWILIVKFLGLGILFLAAGEWYWFATTESFLPIEWAVVLFLVGVVVHYSIGRYNRWKSERAQFRKK